MAPQARQGSFFAAPIDAASEIRDLGPDESVCLSHGRSGHLSIPLRAQFWISGMRIVQSQGKDAELSSRREGVGSRRRTMISPLRWRARGTGGRGRVSGSDSSASLRCAVATPTSRRPSGKSSGPHRTASHGIMIPNRPIFPGHRAQKSSPSTMTKFSSPYGPPRRSRLPITYACPARGKTRSVKGNGGGLTIRLSRPTARRLSRSCR